MSWAFRLEGPMSFVRHEIEQPDAESLRDGEVLLRFRVGGICGSDLPRCRDGVAPGRPAPFGMSLHEIVGEVVETRADLERGERVVGWVANSMGLREYVPTAAKELIPVPAHLDDTDAVALQPLACVLHAVSRLRADLRGARVAILGLGPVGLLFAHVLATHGAQIVGVDRVDRRDMAERYGLADVEHATSRTFALAADTGSFDLVIEVIGHQTGTLDDAIRLAAPDADVVYFGNPDDDYYPLHLGAMMDKALTLQCGRTPSASRREALRAAARYAEQHPDVLQGYVTEVLPALAPGEAYRRAAHPAVGQRKIVLDARD